ncbi:MAG: YcxB family protein [Clostridiales bacterium]|nr:YcxB family protein [Clostridiales bacterium]MCF8022483.1 YcxB family protein [Clostridiales bacterium]
MSKVTVKILNAVLILFFSFSIIQLGIETLKLIFASSDNFYFYFYLTSAICFIFAALNLLPTPLNNKIETKNESPSNQNPIIKITFILTKTDILKFFNFNEKTNKKYKKFNLITLAAGFFLFNSILALLFSTHIIINFFISFFLTMLFSYLINCLKKRKYLSIYYYKNPDAKKERTIILYNDGIRMITNKKDSFTKWNNNISIQEYDNDIIFYFTPGLGLLIPARAFNNIEEKKNFYNLVQQKIAV